MNSFIKSLIAALLGDAEKSDKVRKIERLAAAEAATLGNIQYIRRL